MKRGAAGYWALGWLTVVALAGLLASALPLPFSPTEPDLTHLAAPPHWQGGAPHYLGTDPLGRDVLAGLLFGARRLLVVSLPAAALSIAAGALLGGAAGYWGNHRLRLPLWWGLLPVAGLGWWLRPPVAVSLGAGLLVAVAGRRRLPLPLDYLFLAVSTLLSSVPRLLLVLVLAAGPPLGSSGLLLVLALLAWPDTARLVRTQMHHVRVQPFVAAAQALGLPPARVWWRHALPAACRPLRATAPLTLAALVGLESSLAFLGIGEGPTASSWGQLLGELRQEPGAWWLAAGPGLALFFTLLALQVVARRYAN